MAGIKLRVRSSTILEVLIAMIIIMVVFTIAMMIFANVSNSTLSIKNLKAQAVLNDILLSAENSTSNENKSIIMGDFTIEQTMSYYNGNTSLIQIDLTAFDLDKKKILDIHGIFYQPK